MTKDEALKLALEALEKLGQGKDPRGAQEYITAIEEALAQQCVCGEPNSAGTHRTDGPCLASQPEQEPVAWIEGDEPILTWVKTDPKAIPLYTTPPHRTWVGLTPEEIDSLANLKVDGAYLSVPDTIRQADAKLKEKNNG